MFSVPERQTISRSLKKATLQAEPGRRTVTTFNPRESSHYFRRF